MPPKKNRISNFLVRKKKAEKPKSRRTRNRFLNFIEVLVILKPLLGFFRAKVLLFTLVLTMGGFIIFSLYSPWFEIKNIEIKRDTPDLDLAALKLTLRPFYGKNLIFFDPAAIKSALMKDFKELKNIELEEIWPDQLNVSLQTAQPKYRIQNQATLELGILSEDGVLLENRNKENTLPLIKVSTYEKKFLVGDIFAEKQTLEHMMTLKSNVESALNLSIQDIIYLENAKEVHLVLQNRTALWFDLMIDNISQIEKLKFAAQEIGIGIKPIDHIDVRIPNKLFVK